MANKETNIEIIGTLNSERSQLTLAYCENVNCDWSTYGALTQCTESTETLAKCVSRAHIKNCCSFARANDDIHFNFLCVFSFHFDFLFRRNFLPPPIKLNHNSSLAMFSWMNSHVMATITTIELCNFLPVNNTK